MKVDVYVFYGHLNWWYNFRYNAGAPTPELPFVYEPESVWLSINRAEKRNYQFECIGTIDTTALMEKVQQTAGGYLTFDQTPLSPHIPFLLRTRVILGFDGRIYLFRQPRDILQYKFSPVRMGAVFQPITPELKRAWDEHTTNMHSEVMLTTEQHLWERAYAEVQSCMKSRREILMYAENPQAFELALLQSKQTGRIIARAVVYKDTQGNRYYAHIYGTCPKQKLEQFLKHEGIEKLEHPLQNDSELQPVRIRSSVGIPYMDAFQYGSIENTQTIDGETVYTVAFTNCPIAPDIIARYTKGTQRMLQTQKTCEYCNALAPFTINGMCDYCLDKYEQQYADDEDDF